MDERPWFVYLVRCADNTIYTGISPNVQSRVDKHNSGKGAKYTRTRLPVILIKSFECINHSEAAKLEYKIKQMSRKEKLEYEQ